jgi:rubrerythrin
MAVDLTQFPEIRNFSSVIRYSLYLEEACVDFYEKAAQLKADAADTLQTLAESHRKRITLLEDTRQEKLNEMILEPITGVDREAYLPDVELKESAAEVLQKAIALEENAKKFYTDLTEAAKELSREASKVYKQMAKENGKMIKKLEDLS